MRLPARLAVLLGVISGFACGGEKTFDPPSREARVAEAEALYSPALFDSIGWSSADERALEGNGVYAARCRDCHGTVGRGDTEYARAQGLDMPSLVESEWSMSMSMDSVRHRIFVGHVAGMPQWGVAGISNREIDAVAFYVLERLRPEILNEGGD